MVRAFARDVWAVPLRRCRLLSRQIPSSTHGTGVRRAPKQRATIFTRARILASRSADRANRSLPPASHGQSAGEDKAKAVYATTHITQGNARGNKGAVSLNHLSRASYLLRRCATRDLIGNRQHGCPDQIIPTIAEASRRVQRARQHIQPCADQTLLGLHGLSLALSRTSNRSDACMQAVEGLAAITGTSDVCIRLTDRRGNVTCIVPRSNAAPHMHTNDHLSAQAAARCHDITIPLIVSGEQIGTLTVVLRAMDGVAAHMPSLVHTTGGLVNAALDRIQSRNLLEQRATQLGLVISDLESFAYSVSHDLRAPLRVIEGFSSMLDRHLGENPGEDVRHLLSVIVDNTQRMDQLITDLLSFSRLGTIAIRRAAVDMNSLVASAWADVRAEWREPQVVFAQDDLPVAYGDQALIRQVWINLLSNAVKYSSKRPWPRIEVRGQRTSAECVYDVQDNGAGFSMAYVDRLFGVFQRLHADTEYPGTGIGLANVKRIVTRHGGRVWAESEEDRGATLSFSLPIRAV